MSVLKQELENLRYENVITYLNSGNIIFDYDIVDKDAITKNHERRLFLN